MTVLHDTLPTQHRSRGDTALETINAYRDEMGEQFEVRPLDTEFAFFMHRLGARGLYLADAASNEAGAFKWRGAINKMNALQQHSSEAGVIVPSAGNHLRGAVIAARALDMAIHGVVPTSAPPAKKEGARQLWDNAAMFQLHVEGETFDDSLAWAHDNEHLGHLVHPYDDPLVSAGQGTIVDDTLEAFKQRGEHLDHLVVPIGGGGLFAGALKRAHELDPQLTVHGVEAQGSNSLSRSLEAGQPTAATQPNRKYGGSAVRQTGQHTLGTYQESSNARLWKVGDDDVRRLVDDYEEEIAYRELGKYPSFTPFEPTTLVAIAALGRIARTYPGETIAVVGTGRNDTLDTVWR